MDIIKRNNSIIEDSLNGLNVKQLKDKYNLSESMIRIILKNNNIKYQERKQLTDKDIEYIINRYNYDTSTNISKEIGCSRSAVLKVWKDNNKKGKDRSRKYYCNFNYFNKIDSPNKAYWLGFIAADGCVYKRELCSSSLKIEINKKDIEVLNNFLEDIDGKNPIKTYKNMASIEIVSDIIFNDLGNYNIVPNKTWTFTPKNIPMQYYIDFIIGYFDGDGSICLKNNKNIPSSYQISIVGNLYCLNEIKKMLEEYKIYSDVKVSNRKNKYSKDYFAELRIFGADNKYIFSKLFTNRHYNSLNRKKEKVLKLINLIENNFTNRIENVKAVERYNSLYL